MSNGTGVIPNQFIEEMISSGVIQAQESIPDGNIQPASLDLRIGEGEVVRLPAIFSPGRKDVLVEAKSRSKSAGFFTSQITESGFLCEVGIPYLVPLQERLNLPDFVSARANNKSSSGRINLQVRLLCNGSREYDHVPLGYQGPLYAVVVANSFPVRIKVGEMLCQIRFYQGSTEACLSTLLELHALHAKEGLVFNLEGVKMPWEKVERSGSSVVLSANLRGNIVAYRFKGSSTGALDFASRGKDPADFFEPIPDPGRKGLVLSKDGFYILSTREAFAVPPMFCSEMTAYKIGMGEFRSHFAGFFDPGWGHTTGLRGTPAVLEIIPHETIILDHGDPVCAMELYRMLALPDVVYGNKGNNYLGQSGPRLSKHFKCP